MTLPPRTLPRPLASLGNANSQYSDAEALTGLPSITLDRCSRSAGGFGFSPQVARRVSRGLGVEGFAARVRRRNGGRGARVFKQPVGERVVIALSDVVESKDDAIVAGDGETDGVRAVIVGESRADAASVAEIATALEIGGFRLPGVAGDGAANTAPGAAEREHGGLGIARIDARRARMEIGARHSEVS